MYTLKAPFFQINFMNNWSANLRKLPRKHDCMILEIFQNAQICDSSGQFFYLLYVFTDVVKDHPSRDVLRKRCSENIQ